MGTTTELAREEGAVEEGCWAASSLGMGCVRLQRSLYKHQPFLM